MQDPNVTDDNLDEIDITSDSFRTGVQQLAKPLGIPQHPNHLVTLKAIAICLQRQRTMSDDDLEKKLGNGLNEVTFMSLDQIPVGFDTGNQELNHAARVLRLLLINDLRLLQNQINQLLVSVQSITAHPKTDTALGKVGR